MVEPLRHRQTKGAATDTPGLPRPRHIPTLPRAGPLHPVLEPPGGPSSVARWFQCRPCQPDWGRISPTPQPRRVSVTTMSISLPLIWTPSRPRASAHIRWPWAKLHLLCEQTGARNKVYLQPDTVRVFEQHGVVARRPGVLGGAANDGRAHLAEQSGTFVHVLTRAGSQATRCWTKRSPASAGSPGSMPIAVRAPTQ